MMTFSELYNYLLNDTSDIENISRDLPDHDPYHLDCLLNPQNYCLIWKVEKSKCLSDCDTDCVKSCLYDAIRVNEEGELEINMTLCTGCGACVDACKAKNLTESREIVAVLKALRSAKGPIYVLVAPSFLGQFGSDVTPGKLRNALKQLGFTGMVEVALFADILTLKEALEFDRNILQETDFQLTSCCCPLWIAMIRKMYKELVPKVPGSVSPMIAGGRAIKQLYPDALTVFIGPCLAKKAEAREPDLVGAVDFVLTFKEVHDLFRLFNIDPAAQEDSPKEHSSKSGRIYAYAGGVSEAVKSTVERINPTRKITLRSRRADGVPACKSMMNDLLKGEGKANFYEGMGCSGGCVGGPKVVIKKEECRQHTSTYAEEAPYATPIDNPYVIKLLERLGFDTLDSILKHESIFTRRFN